MNTNESSQPDISSENYIRLTIMNKQIYNNSVDFTVFTICKSHSCRDNSYDHCRFLQYMMANYKDAEET